MRIQNVKIASKQTGSILDANLIFPDKVSLKKDSVFFIHGWQSNQNGNIIRAKTLAENGYACFTFDLRGHGKSNGDINTLTLHDFLNDVILAYDYFRQNCDINPERIGVAGASLGGYLALLLAGERKPRWICLRAPSNYPDNIFKSLPQIKYPRNEHTAVWRNTPLKPNETMSLRAIRSYSGYILMIESGNDETVPHQCIKNYLDAVSDKSKLTYSVMEGADHAIKQEQYQKEYLQILSEWIKDRSC